MAIKVKTDIVYGNACDIAVLEQDGVVEVSFTPDPRVGRPRASRPTAGIRSAFPPSRSRPPMPWLGST